MQKRQTPHTHARSQAGTEANRLIDISLVVLNETNLIIRRCQVCTRCFICFEGPTKLPLSAAVYISTPENPFRFFFFPRATESSLACFFPPVVVCFCLVSAVQERCCATLTAACSTRSRKCGVFFLSWVSNKGEAKISVKENVDLL